MLDSFFKKKLRMFWSCSHVTLRDTEVPLLLKSGIEVIPEEPNESILTKDEYLNYEDGEIYEINKKWRKSCSVNPKELAIIRRANLMRRKGFISEIEKKFSIIG